MVINADNTLKTILGVFLYEENDIYAGGIANA